MRQGKTEKYSLCTVIVVRAARSAQIWKKEKTVASGRNEFRLPVHCLEAFALYNLIFQPFQAESSGDVGSHHHPQGFVYMAEGVAAKLRIKDGPGGSAGELAGGSDIGYPDSVVRNLVPVESVMEIPGSLARLFFTQNSASYNNNIRIEIQISVDCIEFNTSGYGKTCRRDGLF